MARGDKAKESLRQYLMEANGWETDAVARMRRSAKTAWILAFFGLAIGLCGVIAVMGLTPLKQIVPVVIRVDNATGITEVMDQLTNAKTNYQEAVNRYFLQKYVRYREGFNRATAAHNYTAVGLMSATNEQANYGDWFSPRNPASPLNTHGEGHRTEISIRSTSFLSPQTALVRFIREQHQPGSAKPILSYWAATLTFTYQNPPTSQKDREINPLGFQVTGYRVDPESLSAVEGTATPQLAPQQLPVQPTEVQLTPATSVLAPMPQPTLPPTDNRQPQLQPAAPQPLSQPIPAQPVQVPTAPAAPPAGIAQPIQQPVLQPPMPTPEQPQTQRTN